MASACARGNRGYGELQGLTFLWLHTLWQVCMPFFISLNWQWPAD
jgi:hypothetical protein